MSRRNLLVVASLALLTVCPLPAKAAVIFAFDKVLSGGTPAGSAPWATLTIEDESPGVVKLTLQANLQYPGEFISYLLLNIDPFVTVSLVSNSVVGPAKIESVTADEDGFTDVAEQYDLKVKFETSGRGAGADHLTGNETLSWKLSGTGLKAANFLAKTVLPGQQGGVGSQYALIHVQGLRNGESSKVGASVVPEPATLLLFGLGLAAPLAIRQRKR